MKKKFKYLFVCCILSLSTVSFMYINKVENNTTASNMSFSEMTDTKDQLVSSVKAATLVMDRLIDFISSNDQTGSF